MLYHLRHSVFTSLKFCFYADSGTRLNEKQSIELMISSNTGKSKPDRPEGLKVVSLYKRITLANFGEEVRVYNGHRFVPINITLGKVGSRYRRFVLTKRIGSNIHKKKSKKLNNKNGQ